MHPPAASTSKWATTTVTRGLMAKRTSSYAEGGQIGACAVQRQPKLDGGYPSGASVFKYAVLRIGHAIAWSLGSVDPSRFLKLMFPEAAVKATTECGKYIVAQSFRTRSGEVPSTAPVSGVVI